MSKQIKKGGATLFLDQKSSRCCWEVISLGEAAQAGQKRRPADAVDLISIHGITIAGGVTETDSCGNKNLEIKQVALRARFERWHIDLRGSGAPKKVPGGNGRRRGERG